MTQDGRLLAGASGYSFKEWKGHFYPDRLPAANMLAWYSARLPTVEINNTFYRLPRAAVVENWAATTPEPFVFSIKAPRRITQFARLGEASAEPLEILYRNLEPLGPKRGPVLFQVPQGLKKDVGLLRAFLARLPEDHRAAFEFRSASWLCDEVYEALASAGAALSVSEREEEVLPPLVSTTTWGYVRLRLEAYAEADLQRWAERLHATSWQRIYAYFMHEPTAPAYAARLIGLWPRDAGQAAEV